MVQDGNFEPTQNVQDLVLKQMWEYIKPQLDYINFNQNCYLMSNLFLHLVIQIWLNNLIVISVKSYEHISQSHKI